MNKVNKLVLFLMFICIPFNLNAGFLYEYVCINTDHGNSGVCNKTKLQEIDQNIDYEVLIKTNTSSLNIDNSNINIHIDNKLNNLINTFGSSTFNIKNFYTEGTGGRITLLDSDKEIYIRDTKYRNMNLSMEELLDMDYEIKIVDNDNNIISRYNDGKDYLFTNFDSIIRTLNSKSTQNIDNNLSYFHENILSYNTDNNEVIFRNVCIDINDIKCLESEVKSYALNDTNKLLLLNGDKSNFVPKFKVEPDTYNGDLFGKAGEANLPINFIFHDILEGSKERTKYTYKIYQDGVYNNIVDSVITGSIFIDKNFNITNAGFTNEGVPLLNEANINDFFNLTVKNYDTKSFKLEIIEPAGATKVDDYNFYFEATNDDTLDKAKKTKVNAIPIEIIHSDKPGLATFEIIGKEMNQEDGFIQGTSYDGLISLTDIFGNSHFDNVNNGGYNLSVSSKTTTSISIGKTGKNIEYGQTITNLSSNNSNKIPFRIIFNEDGINQKLYLDLSIKVKEELLKYKMPLTTNFKNDIVRTFDVDIPPVFQANTKCKKDSIKVTALCTKDNTSGNENTSGNNWIVVSGCNKTMTESQVYNFKHDKNNKGSITDHNDSNPSRLNSYILNNPHSDNFEDGDINHLIYYIYDNAGSQTSKSYTQNHIDKSAPTFTIKDTDGNNIIDGSSLIAADNNIIISVDDYAPSGCLAEIDNEDKQGAKSRINLIVKLDGTQIYNKTKYGAHQATFNTNNIQKNLLRQAGTKRLELIATDYVGNITTQEFNFTIYPNPFIKEPIITLETSKGSIYSGTGSYEYKIQLVDSLDNPIHGKEIISIEHIIGNGSNSTFKTLTTDNGSYAISIDFIGGINTTDNDGFIYINLSSDVAGLFSQRFHIKLKSWNKNYINQNNILEETGEIGSSDYNYFNKPFIGELSILKIDEEGTSSWDGTPEVLMNQTYRLKLIDKAGIIGPGNKVTRFKIKDFTNDILTIKQSVLELNHINPSLTNINTNQYLSDDMQFGIRLNTTNAAIRVEEAGIKIEYPKIIYKINGKNISYDLTSNIDPNFKEAIKIESDNDNSFRGLKIIGLKQSGGKSDMTSNQTLNTEDISEIDKLKLRGVLQKNAYDTVRHLSSNKTKSVGGIWYVKGDLKLSELPSDAIKNNDTIIVEEGNFYIDINMNKTKNLGIVVLKPNYNIEEGYKTDGGGGNLYIETNVTYINAIIYAEGGLISTHLYNVLDTNNADRTALLNKQLVMYGSMFTRNTIGGTLLGGGYTDYVLPGQQLTSNLDHATIYDLNMVRRGLGIADADNLNNDDPFVVIHKSNKNLKIFHK